MSLRQLQICAVICLIALIFLGLAWELPLAPLAPGGTWWALKVLPLLAALRGFLHGRRYTFQWMSMAVLLYVAEGIVRAMTDAGLSAILAGLQLLLATTLFVLCLLVARNSAPSRMAKPT